MGDSYNQEMEGKTSQADQIDNFKPIFKKYKRRDKPLDLKEVIDLETMTDASGGSVERVKPIVPDLTPVAGLKPVQEWSIFHFPHLAGFYLIQNPFLPGSQRYWVSRCLQDLPPPPNITNLTVHPDLDPHTLWESFVNDFLHRGHAAYNSSSPLRKLRWTTIGYHYHWDTKEYKEEDHTPFPQDIGVLAHYVARVLGFPDFQAEAGIVNYYHHDSSLAAHTDHSELDHEAPLVSISFGQDAIFLMGGPTKEQTPTAVRLHSGDICVMSGKARLAHHAVPRILPSPSPSSSSSPPPCFDMRPEDWRRVCSWDENTVGDTPGCMGDTFAYVEDAHGLVGESIPECSGDTPGCFGVTPGSVGDLPGSVGENTPGGVAGDTPRRVGDEVVVLAGDAASCVSPTSTSLPAEGIQTVSENSHMELHVPTTLASSSQERDTHTHASDGSFRTSAPPHTAKFSVEKMKSHPASKDDEHTNAQRAKHSPQNSELSDVGQGKLFNKTASTQHTTKSPSEESHSHSATESPSGESTGNSLPAAREGSFTSSQQERGSPQRSDPQPETYEERVKKVNRQLVSTLQKQDWGPFAAYLSSSRLNVNIRQVLKAGHSFHSHTSRQDSPVKKPRTETSS
ncbi:hypothetical protein ACOMHN_006456 [Nucella lapillus]